MRKEDGVNYGPGMCSTCTTAEIVGGLSIHCVDGDAPRSDVSAFALEQMSGIRPALLRRREFGLRCSVLGRTGGPIK